MYHHTRLTYLFIYLLSGHLEEGVGPLDDEV
jgi:hypothetical protein